MKRQSILVAASLLLVSCSGLCQTVVAPKILNATDWKNYFVKHFKVTATENINTQVNKGDIPYPTSWKYLGDKDKDKKDKYRLYTLSPTADFMTMPTANNVSTYLFFFDHSNPANNLMEMNFFADSIICKKLSNTMYMFQFNDDGFKINGDSSGFKRYVFISNTGKLISKSLVAHGCSITLNSVDTVHSLIYLNVIYTKHPSCMKCFRLDYKNQLLLTDLDDVEDLNGSIILDAVHYTYIKKVEGSAN